VREVKIEYELENVEMDVSSAIPIGLIMNELITNSIKHAFEDTEEPHIWIRLEKVGDKLLELTVRDNGKGMEEEVDNPEVGLGLDLIKSLTDQLDGKSTFQNERGVHFHLVIPYSK
jgi:two-component sensor histidine kinase